MMTRTLPMVPLALALRAACKRADRPYWCGRTSLQEAFLLLVSEFEPALGRYDQWTAVIAAPTAAEINAWLAERGFGITLDDWTDENDFGVAGYSDVRVNWVETGEKSVVFTDDDTYPAFELDTMDGVAAVYTDSSGQPVVELQTKEGMIARIQMRDDPGDAVALADAGLRQHLAELGVPWLHHGSAYGQVRIPMVHLNEQANLEWLIGLYMPKPGAPGGKIAQAVGQTKFAMNETGARNTDTAAAQVAFESVHGVVYEVNEAFLLTIGFTGVAPVVVAYITEENWVEPGDLSNL